MNAIVNIRTHQPEDRAVVDAPRLLNDDGKPASIMIDGFNLSLEKGTGVSTYARNLSFSLRDLGCRTEVLYGGSASRRHSSLLQEISFYDSQSLSINRWQHLARRVRSSLSPNRNTAFEVPLSGRVVPDTFKSRLPHYESIWNATDLYVKSSTQFDVFGLVNQVSVPRKPDLCHWTYPLPIRLKGVPNIYTLHDLVPLRLPYSTLDKKDRYLSLIKWIARTADHIVTVSESSRRDLIEIAGVRPEQVTNTFQTVSFPETVLNRTEAAVRREVEGMFGLGFKNYFLFYGSIEPKKNVGRLIEGYLGSGVNTPLVIVGAQSWKSENELRPLAYNDIRQEMNGAGGKVVRLEYVSLSLLVSLIRGAKSVLFPSLYEGFGLPVLESMLLGTPVLSSNTSSIPEVAGDAAVLVNPYDSREIADGVRLLDSNEELRRDLAERGKKRAALFGNGPYQSRLAEVYRKVLDAQPKRRKSR